ncbi:MAG: branched-chain amino acid transaminase [Candidatus Diapherotrites archaeon]|nr:branched-chain amino acid transaminase [Candidatus Diapherotrites archaeon]
MQEAKWIWLNGSLVPWKKAQVHFLTHALHYGTAVFEGIRAYKTERGTAVFRLKDHIKRLFNSAHVLGIEVPYTNQQLYDATIELIKANKLEECYIRPLVFLDYGEMGLNPLKCKVSVGIAAWSWGTYLGEEGIKNGIRAKIASFSRSHVNAQMTKAKISGNYVNSALAKAEAILAGYDEAIMLDTNGFVSEATGENLFIVRDSVLISTPKATVLEGITRDSVIKIAEAEGIKFKEEKLTRDQLYIADEVFLTGTAAEITPVREIDNRTIGNGKPGEITRKIQKIFFDIVRGKDKRFNDWLDLVK